MDNIEEIDDERLKRIKEIGLFRDSKDLLVQAKSAKPISEEEVQHLLKSVSNEYD